MTSTLDRDAEVCAEMTDASYGVAYRSRKRWRAAVAALIEIRRELGGPPPGHLQKCTCMACAVYRIIARIDTEAP